MMTGPRSLTQSCPVVVSTTISIRRRSETNYSTEQDEGNVKFSLFSATFPKAARDLAKNYLAASHVRFRVGRAGSTTANIKQIVLQAEAHEKKELLVKLLEEMHGIRTIIFVNSRQAADNLDDFL